MKIDEGGKHTLEVLRGDPDVYERLANFIYYRGSIVTPHENVKDIA